MNYFHIQRINGIRKEWNKGDFAETSDNDFFKGILEGIERITKYQPNPNRLIQKSREMLSNEWMNSLDYQSKDFEKLFYKTQDLCIDYEGLATNLFESHLQYLKWIREEIFESSRLNINPNLPSRKKCLWLCDKKGLENWWNTFENSENKKIIELELDKKGKIHLADAEFLNLDTYSIEEFHNSSKKYWNGEMNTEFDIEILYEGKFKVINEFKNIEEIKTYT